MSERHWKRAQERLAAQGKVLAPLSAPSLANRIALLGQGACDCNTKSHDVHMHLPTCRFRQVMELADEVEAVSDLLAEAETFIANLSGGGETEFRERIRRRL